MESEEQLHAGEARRLAEESVDKVLGRFGVAFLTPPFALRWPPVGERKVVYFGCEPGMDAPSASITHHLRSPFIEVTVSVDPRRPAALGFKRLAEQDLGSQSEGAERVRQEDLDAAAEALFRAVSTSQPAESDLRLIRRTYRRWRMYNDLLWDDLKARLPDFFAWLEEP